MPLTGPSEGRPLIERVTTVGGLVRKPGNFLVRIGTPLSALIEAAGGMEDGVKQFLYGGPMMGMAISRTDIPVTKGCSGILCLGQEAMEPHESACIRCGRCMRACPMNLAPAKIDALMRADRYEAAAAIGAMNCIECGCCTFVCPAKRKISTQSCRVVKRVVGDRRRKAQVVACRPSGRQEGGLSMQKNLAVSSSPHLRDHVSTRRIMQEVCLHSPPRASRASSQWSAGGRTHCRQRDWRGAG